MNTRSLLGVPSNDPPSGYNLSFTAASLRPDLSRIIARAFLDTDNWQLAKERVLSANALQCRSVSSAVRLERELRRRLTRLTTPQLTLVAHAVSNERAAMSWLAACKHIPFIFEFATEVLRDKLAAHDSVLRPSDYEGYLESKSLDHPELSGLAATSRRKLRQVLRLMLNEAGLLEPGTDLGTIKRPTLSPEVVQTIAADHPKWLAAFLVPDGEIEKIYQ